MRLGRLKFHETDEDARQWSQFVPRTVPNNHSGKNLHGAQSTAAVVEISGNQAHDFRGGEEEIGERRNGECDVAEVGVAADAMCEDAARRDGVADPERAADGANGEVEKENKKRKKKRDHYGRRRNVEAAEQVGDEKYAEVDELSVDSADIDCQDAKRRMSSGMLKRRPLTKREPRTRERADEVAYYEEGKALTRDSEWDEIECVDADDAKVENDVDGAASAEDERAVAEASNNKAEKSEKAKKSKREKPEKPDDPSGSQC
ncbi:hypothetical protein HPB52_011899 [Rhipicephalus sanguineus]|uniref:Uncharacterized protein n=1 Tax=Rhipicephalus sanguineus TaxID=34632 RepID=A0A9D4PIK4_RHISA|nr:hypothetical protein HPB52_011899 [Rhipicephalus sanguineus]